MNPISTTKRKALSSLQHLAQLVLDPRAHGNGEFAAKRTRIDGRRSDLPPAAGLLSITNTIPTNGGRTASLLLDSSPSNTLESSYKSLYGRPPGTATARMNRTLVWFKGQIHVRTWVLGSLLYIFGIVVELLMLMSTACRPRWHGDRGGSFGLRRYCRCGSLDSRCGRWVLE